MTRKVGSAFVKSAVEDSEVLWGGPVHSAVPLQVRHKIWAEEVWNMIEHPVSVFVSVSVCRPLVLVLR